MSADVSIALLYIYWGVRDYAKHNSDWVENKNKSLMDFFRVTAVIFALGTESFKGT